jgi:hypothetical protein
MRHQIALYASLAICCITACTKHDVCPEPPVTTTDCDFAQSLVTYLTDHPYTRTQYEKEYDESGRAVKVRAGIFGAGLRSSHTFQLRYNGSTVCFIEDGSTTDTALIAHFDGAGRLQEMIQGKDAPTGLFLPVLFAYKGGRLAHAQIISGGPGISLYTKYDTNGNVIMLSDSTDLDFTGFTYTYDLSVTATEQFYSDDFYDRRYNALYLAEFLGWLPDLQPVNKRISSEMFGDVIPLTNHVYDSLGRLVSYESGQDFSQYQLRFTNVWNCGGKKQALPN